MYRMYRVFEDRAGKRRNFSLMKGKRYVPDLKKGAYVYTQEVDGRVYWDFRRKIMRAYELRGGNHLPEKYEDFRDKGFFRYQGKVYDKGLGEDIKYSVWVQGGTHFFDEGKLIKRGNFLVDVYSAGRGTSFDEFIRDDFHKKMR